jgi:hypothetical protein
MKCGVEVQAVVLVQAEEVEQAEEELIAQPGAADVGNIKASGRMGSRGSARRAKARAVGMNESGTIRNGLPWCFMPPPAMKWVIEEKGREVS